MKHTRVFGWRVVCQRFVGTPGRLQMGLDGLLSLPEFHLILINITSTQWKQTPLF